MIMNKIYTFLIACILGVSALGAKAQIVIGELNYHSDSTVNSGDWIENLTSLEYHNGAWQIYQHQATAHAAFSVEDEQAEVSIFEIFENSSLDEALLLSKLLHYAKAG